MLLHYHRQQEHPLPDPLIGAVIPDFETDEDDLDHLIRLRLEDELTSGVGGVVGGMAGGVESAVFLARAVVGKVTTTVGRCCARNLVLCEQEG